MQEQNGIQPDQFDYILSLLPKLHASINPSSSSNQHEINPVMTNLYKRILSSRWNIIQTNETQLINNILDSADKLNPSSTGQNIASIERLQSLYSRLTKKRVPTRRWACLYLLNGLSINNNSEQFKTASILGNMIKMNQQTTNVDNKIENDINCLNYLKNEQNSKNSNNLDLNNNTYVKRPSPIVVNLSKTTKIITEKDLLNDLMFIFQGIDGHYITYNSQKDMFCLNSVIPFNEDIYDTIYFLSELGWLYRKVSKYLTFFNESNIPSQFIQSFSYAIQSELNEYYKLISFFKKKNSQSENAKNESNANENYGNYSDDLTLKNLVLWTIEPIERMKWLEMSCEGVCTLRGTSVLSQIYSYVNFAGGEVYLKRVLEEISKPFLFLVRNWIMYGDLQDPYKEFFVNILDKINDDDIWTLKYEIVYKNIPNFLNRNLAIKIFEIGKCIHFIKNYCGESDYNLAKIKLILIDQINNYYNRLKEDENKMDIVMEDNSNVNNIQNLSNNGDNNQQNVNPVNKENNTQFIDINSYQSCLDFLNSLDNYNIEMPNSIYDNQNNNQYTQNQTNTTNFLSELLIQLDLLHSLINKELITILFNKFHLKENLVSLNRYLLLGQGDMMQSLMESLYEELKKPASHIYKHNLQANLENAIRASNAQYNDKECLKKLNIKLMDPNAGDTGWDIFLLEYKVDVPLTVIFNKNLLKEYQKLFFFFWRLKRLEYSQNQQVWRKFMTYSHALRKNFDSMRKVIQRSMLFNQQVVHFVSNLHNFLALEVLETQYKKIIDVLPKMTSLDELIEVHKKFVENITRQSLLNSDNSAIYKKIMGIFDLIIRFRIALDVLTTTLLEGHYENMNNNEFNESLIENKQYSNEASIQIYTLFDQFKIEVTELINTIECFGKGNLKYLAMKLDYNYYYSILQKEKENQEQQNMLNQINKEEQIQRQNEIMRRRQINQGYDNMNESRRNQDDEENFREDPSGVGNDVDDYEGDAGNEEEEIGDSHRIESVQNTSSRRNIDVEEDVQMEDVHLQDLEEDKENAEDYDNDEINMNVNDSHINTTSLNRSGRSRPNQSQSFNQNLNQSQSSNLENSRYSNNSSRRLNTNRSRRTNDNNNS